MSSAPIFPEQLQAFYAHYFPTEDFINWLSYEGVVENPKNYLQRREFSWTIKDAYVRFKSVGSVEEFTKSILNKSPDKLDIGAVYTLPPCDKEKVAVGKFVPQEKELVFDIDLTDYDDVRFCGCKETSVCRECWQFAGCAMLVLEELLGNVFGSKHRMWIFSGRRGVHCWVCDDSFRKLTLEARTQIADFVSVYLGGDKNKFKKLSLNTVATHPTFDVNSTIFKLCEQYFVELFIDKWQILEKKPSLILEKLQKNKQDMDKVEAAITSANKQQDAKTAWQKLKDKLVR